jgi:AraC-like DNA-binding protein
MPLTPATERWRRAFLVSLADPSFAEALFDRIPDVVFSIKDREGRYVCISKACVERCGLRDKSEAIGRTAHDLFPRFMAERYAHQDEVLFRTRMPVIDSLDLTLYPDRSQGWCLSNKLPLRDRQGEVVGLACISEDLVEPGRTSLIDKNFAATIDHIQAHFDHPLRIPALARMAGLSMAQFERRVKSIFHISAMQFLIKTRIQAVSQALAEQRRSIADIALSSGFCDQSSLSRQFKQLTGLSPRQYRQMLDGTAPI